jgi:hypothetical protein
MSFWKIRHFNGTWFLDEHPFDCSLKFLSIVQSFVDKLAIPGFSMDLFIWERK